jgi:hypothetical protein
MLREKERKEEKGKSKDQKQGKRSNKQYTNKEKMLEVSWPLRKTVL